MSRASPGSPHLSLYWEPGRRGRFYPPFLLCNLRYGPSSTWRILERPRVKEPTCPMFFQRGMWPTVSPKLILGRSVRMK